MVMVQNGKFGAFIRCGALSRAVPKVGWVGHGCRSAPGVGWAGFGWGGVGGGWVGGWGRGLLLLSSRWGGGQEVLLGRQGLVVTLAEALLSP